MPEVQESWCPAAQSGHWPTASWQYRLDMQNAPGFVQPLTPPQNHMGVPGAPFTTLMLRNLPRKYTMNALLAELTHHIQKSCIDFAYMPHSRRTSNHVGFAFVNFVDTEKALQVQSALHGRPWTLVRSTRPIIAIPAYIQGFHDNLAHCASCITPGADASHLPWIYVDGEQVPFQMAVHRFLDPQSNSASSTLLGARQLSSAACTFQVAGGEIYSEQASMAWSSNHQAPTPSTLPLASLSPPYSLQPTASFAPLVPVPPPPLPLCPMASPSEYTTSPPQARGSAMAHDGGAGQEWSREGVCHTSFGRASVVHHLPPRQVLVDGIAPGFAGTQVSAYPPARLEQLSAPAGAGTHDNAYHAAWLEQLSAPAGGSEKDGAACLVLPAPSVYGNTNGSRQGASPDASQSRTGPPVSLLQPTATLNTRHAGFQSSIEVSDAYFRASNEVGVLLQELIDVGLASLPRRERAP